jgi:hypothetical protein
VTGGCGGNFVPAPLTSGTGADAVTATVCRVGNVLSWKTWPL